MIYIRLASVFILVGMSSGLCAMKMSLKDLAADAILKDTVNVDRLDQEKEGVPHNVVRERFLSENLRDIWEVLPEVKPLLPRGNPPLKGLSFLGSSACAVTATKKGELFWWDTRNVSFDAQGQPVPLCVRDTGHNELSAMAVSSDGNFIATAGGRTVRIWTSDTYVCLGSLEHPYDVCVVSFNDTATEIVVGGTRGEISAWDLEKNRNTPRSVVTHARLADDLASLNRVLAIRLSSCGTKLFSAGYVYIPGGHQVKPCIKIWDRSTSQCTKEIVLNSLYIMGKISFIDDTRAVACFTNGDLLETNLELGTTKKTHLPGLKLETCTLSKDGCYLLTAGANKKVVLCHKVAEDYQVVKEFEGSGIIMNHCALRADGTMFLVGSCFGSLDMWSVDLPGLSLGNAQHRLKMARRHEGEICSTSKDE